jgi:dTDP-4-amino-4,6-dideoxygalactose transaminase
MPIRSTIDMPADAIPFIDLATQRKRLGSAVVDAIARVVDRGDYILGLEVDQLERELARFCGVEHALSCASGTDALVMLLMAWGVGPGDAVYVPSFTFAASAEVVALVGATPVFVDIDPVTFNMDPHSLASAIAATRELRPRAVIVVDVFGQPADYDAIGQVVDGTGILVLSDAAQSFGATRGDLRAGAWGDAAATSFYPAKPLGCYGDGGALFVHDAELAALLTSIRVHGSGSDKYDNVRIGINGRMDTIQAAVLLAKLEIFDEELVARQLVADRYDAGLDGCVVTPEVVKGCTSSWAQYTVMTEDRDGVAQRLGDAGIPTAVHYRIPLHLQTAYRRFPSAPDGLGVSEEVAGRVLSLPMHPYLETTTQDRIIDGVRSAVRA